jgi:hypothetical protein
VYALSIAVAGAALALPARGQAVISTRSGVVHYFEGEVYVAGQRLEARFGKFTSIPEGAELRTEQGRAEVLLTPGAFLRVGEKSVIRMITNALSDTRVELLAGSAVVNSLEPAVATSVTLIYKNWSARQTDKGIYRIDSEPPRLRVREGEVEVATANADGSILVGQGMELPFAELLAPEKLTSEPHDALSDWADGRAESISADNTIAANIEDPATMSGTDLPAGSFTYFPMLGLAAFGTGLSGAYGSVYTYPYTPYGAPGVYQPGFYSIYLPGYTRRPLLLGLPAGGLQRSLYSPSRIGVPGSPPPHMPIVRPTAPRPLPRGGLHVGGGHR